MRVELRLGCGEEAPAGEDLSLEVGEERVGERVEPSGALGRPRGLDHLADEDLARRVDRRQLQLLLRAEVRIEAALRHARVLGQAADRKTVEAFDGGELRGRVEDRRAAALAVRAPSFRGGLGRSGEQLAQFRLDKIARPVVLCTYGERPIVLTTDDRPSSLDGRAARGVARGAERRRVRRVVAVSPRRRRLGDRTCSRSAVLRNFPTPVFGISSTNSKASGSHHFANCGSRNSRSSSGGHLSLAEDARPRAAARPTSRVARRSPPPPPRQGGP